MDEQTQKEMDMVDMVDVVDVGSTKKPRRGRTLLLLIGGLMVLAGALLSLGLAAYSFAQEATPEAESPAEPAAPGEGKVSAEPEAVWHRLPHIAAAEVGPLYSRESVEAALETAVANGVLTEEESAGILADIEENAASAVAGRAFSMAMPALEGAEPTFFAAPLGFIRALESAKEEGTLTEADVQAILTDLQAIVGDAITIERSPAERTVGEDETSHFFNALRVEISGLDSEAMEEAIGQALDNAVAAGRLTAEEAEAIREEAEEFDTSPWSALHLRPDGAPVEGLPVEGMIGIPGFHVEALGDLPELEEGIFVGGRIEHLKDTHLLERLELQLSKAVEEGRLTQAEADQMLESLRGALSESAE